MTPRIKEEIDKLNQKIDLLITNHVSHISIGMEEIKTEVKEIRYDLNTAKAIAETANNRAIITGQQVGSIEGKINSIYSKIGNLDGKMKILLPIAIGILLALAGILAKG